MQRILNEEERLDQEVGEIMGLRRGKLDFIPISEEPMCAVFSDRFDLTGYDAVPIKILDRYPLILESFDRDTNAVFEKAGLKPAAKYYSKECVAMLSMARQSVGVAILPELVLKLFPGGFEYRRLDPPVSRTLGIGVRDRKSCGPSAGS